jgi:hypothetical protein
LCVILCHFSKMHCPQNTGTLINLYLAHNDILRQKADDNVSHSNALTYKNPKPFSSMCQI